MTFSVENRRSLRVARTAPLLFLGGWFLESDPAKAQSLASFEHHVVGAQLRVSPAELFIPKSVPGSLAIDIVTSDGSRPTELDRWARGTYVEAVLRGPAFPAYRLLGVPNEPLRLPPIALPGEYQIDNIRLVSLDDEEHPTLMMATPSRVTVHVFSELLVSHVSSRPLSIDEIQQRGIVIDASNFGAVEFTATFLLGGKTLPVHFPVVSPKFREATELIPAAELEERLAFAAQLNREIAHRLVLPEPLNLPSLNIHITGLNFQKVSDGEDEENIRLYPSIAGLLVIPGNIGFLNQFFSAQLFTANAAPAGSNLTIHELTAEFITPSSADPALRLARTIEDVIPPAIIPLRAPGPDGATGTSDDQGRLQPGQTAQGEFLIEGLKTGLHTFDIHLRGVLDGFAAGEIAIEGTAIGSVRVENPKFSLAFSHPATVRAGETYISSMTVMNTSDTPANLVTVNLHAKSISGAELVDGSSPSVLLGTILPGESKTASFTLRSQRTGGVLFSNLTGDDGLSGSFDLTHGVDERGVSLSSKSIGYPHWVSALPSGLRAAADRVLGQALSAATAGFLPPGVRRVEPQLVERRAIELAEAGQRLRYGDQEASVYLDLLLDWQGGRVPSLAFDQILRETTAGSEFRGALIAVVESGETLVGQDWIEQRSVGWAGRGERWGVAATDHQLLKANVEIGAVVAGSGARDLVNAGAYDGSGGSIVTVLDPGQRGSEVEVVFTVPPNISGTASWTQFYETGRGDKFSLTIPSQALTVCYHFFPDQNPSSAISDVGCMAQSSGQISVTQTEILEIAPEMISATQDLGVLVGRPRRFCGGPKYELAPNDERFYENYGTLVAVLFSKPIDPASVEHGGTFLLDGTVRTNGVSVQPGGRVVLVNLADGVGTLLPESQTLAASGVVDLRANVLSVASVPVSKIADRGVRVDGRVFGIDAQPVAGVPVTLIMHDRHVVGPNCSAIDVRVTQTFSGPDGEFEFNFVMGDIVGYSVAATDTRGLNPATVNFLRQASPAGELDPEEITHLAADPFTASALRASFGDGNPTSIMLAAENIDRAVFRDQLDSARIGSTVPVALRFRGRGIVSGVVYASDGVTPVAGAAVNLYPDLESREKARGVFSGTTGRFEFAGIPLGAFSVDVQTGGNLRRTVAGRLSTPGQRAELAIVLSEEEIETGELEGRVLEADASTPHAGATVALRSSDAIIAVIKGNDAGYFRFQDIPVGDYDLIAISFDGRRTGKRTNVPIQSGVLGTASVLLTGTAEVRGRVVYADGSNAAGAVVSGGRELAVTDANGAFVLLGVPVGPATLAAARERAPALGIDVTRFGNTRLDVIAGVTNYALIRLQAAGGIYGTVRNPNHPQDPIVRNIEVALPVDGGFYWTTVDENGGYRFNNIPLGRYLVAAPAPPIQTLEGVLQTIPSRPTQEELLAVLGEVAAMYTSPQGADYRPANYGFARTELTVDGVEVEVNIEYIPHGTISGVVSNENDIPIRAAVSAYGLRPDKTGKPVFGLISETNSDSSTGEYSAGGIRRGNWLVSASSPFYPRPATRSGETVTVLDVPEIDLRFTSQLTRGDLRGVVTRDGAPVEGAQVIYARHPLASILTGEGGIFEIGDLALGVQTRLEIFDPDSNRSAFAELLLREAETFVNIPLLAKTGGLEVVVLQANHAFAEDAWVKIRRIGPYPIVVYEDDTEADGSITFPGLDEGYYAVNACFQPGQTELCVSGTGVVTANGTSSIVLTLGPAGTVSGTYFEADGITPVAFAQVSIGHSAYAVTDAAGLFSISGIPLGVHDVIARNAVTGRAASAIARVLYADHQVQVSLREDALGEVTGRVIGNNGASAVPAAIVTLAPENRLFGTIRVTADPAGRFHFPGIPPGPFTLRAQHPTFTAFAGEATGTMSSGGGLVQVDVHFVPRANLTVIVQRADGTLDNDAQVTLRTANSVIGPTDTSSSGEAEFENILLGEVRLEARSKNTNTSHSTGYLQTALVTPGDAPPVTIRLRGVGTVTAHVINTQGNVENAAVVLEMDDQFDGLKTVDLTEGAGGIYTFHNVALGPVRLRASLVAAGATAEGTLSANGQVLERVLELGPTANVIGTLVDIDNLPVPHNEIILTYTPTSEAAPSSRTRTLQTGAFEFSAVPLGPIGLRGVVPRLNGVIYRNETITGNFDFGPVMLDQEQPRVVESWPDDGATDVPVDTAVEVIFSELMDVTFEDETGIYLTNGNQRIPARTSWSNGHLFIRPFDEVADQYMNFESDTTYTLVVVAGPAYSGAGLQIGHGPVDLAQRALESTWVSSFTTRDAVPPEIVSFTPEPGQLQVDVESVVRINFNEPMDPESIEILLESPTDEVVGLTSVTLNQQVAVFVPASNLEANTIYTATLVSARDLAGNSVVPQANHTRNFTTIDTMGPAIESSTRSGAPVAGGRVTFTLTLAAPETQVQGRVIFNPLPSEHWSQPSSGSTSTVEIITHWPAVPGDYLVVPIAVDRYGNPGSPDTTETVTVLPNTPPELTIARTTPADGDGLLTGQPYRLTIEAEDDGEIAEINAEITGAFEQSETSDSSPLLVEGDVSGALGPGLSITVRATAIDTSGMYTVVEETIAILDGADPTVEAVPPETMVGSGSTLELAIGAQDAFGVVALELVASGAFEDTVHFPIEPAQTAFEDALSLNIPSDIPHGEILNLRVLAYDQAGNIGEHELDPLTVVDQTPPIATTYPLHGAQNVPGDSTITVTFSEPVLDVTSESFYLTRNGERVEALLTFNDGDTIASLSPNALLLDDTEYTIHLTGEIEDEHQNDLIEVTATFRTVDAGNRTPAIGLIPFPLRGLRLQSTHYVQFPASVADLEGGFTFELWNRPIDQSGLQTILDAGTGHALRIQYDRSTERYVFAINSDGDGTEGAGFFETTAGFVSPREAWHHLAVTYDGETFHGYVDGLPAVEDERPEGNVHSDLSQLRLLGAGDSTNPAQHTELRMWSSARSLTAIREVLHLFIPATEPDLWAAWRISASGGTTVAALGGNTARNATVNTGISFPLMIAPTAELLEHPVINMRADHQTIALSTYDLDDESVEIRVDQLPAHGTLYLSSGGVPGAEVTTTGVIGTNSRELRYVIDANYFGSDEIRFVASDGSRDSRVFILQLNSLSLRAFRTSATTTDWSDPANWDPTGVPTSSDLVRIPSGKTVQLATTASLSILEVEGTLNTNNLLTVSSRTTALGNINGGMSAGGLVRGNFSRLTIAGALNGPLHVTGNLTVNSLFILGEHTAQVDGNLSANLSAGARGIIMDQPTSTLDVRGNFTLLCFGNDEQVNTLSDGTLTVRGTFYAQENDAERCFNATPDHLTIFDGTTAPEVTITAHQRFGDLSIPAGANIDFSGHVVAHRLEVQGILRTLEVELDGDFIAGPDAEIEVWMLGTPIPRRIRVTAPGECFIDTGATFVPANPRPVVCPSL